MLNLINAIIASVTVSVFLKVARRLNIHIGQAIAINYLAAITLTYFILKPNFANQSIGQIFADNQHSVIFLALGILLPLVFIIMAKAIEYAGIVRSDAAQRLSLFLPIIASFAIFGEQLTNYKLMSLIIAFIALFCLLYKKESSTKSMGAKGGIVLLLVWLGYGVIDIMFKQMAKLGGQFTITLFVAFCLAACVMLIYLLLRRTHWTGRSMLAGIVLGCLNFVNIYFYIRAHQTLSNDPTTVFTGMNIGVISLGALVGILVFKEKISRINFIGIVLGIISIITLYNLS